MKIPDMEHIGAIAEREFKEFRITKRQLKKVEAIEMVRRARDEGKQSLGYSSRPFILCGLPIRRRKDFEYTRRNGQFFLNIVGHPRFGLPYGQDRLIPIWVSTLAVLQKNRTIHFDSAAEILRTFDLPLDGKSYKRMVDGFQRIFASTIFFGTDEQLEAATVIDWGRFHFFDRLQLWFAKDVKQPTLPSEFRNTVVLSESFWEEIKRHPIPIDMAAVRALASSPGCLDFFLWLTWRSWLAKRPSQIPLFGETGLNQQLGTGQYSRLRLLRRQLNRWLKVIKTLWPECPARLSADGQYLLVKPAPGAIHSRQ